MTGATSFPCSVDDDERHGEPVRTFRLNSSAPVGGTDDDTNRLTADDSEAGALLSVALADFSNAP